MEGVNKIMIFYCSFITETEKNPINYNWSDKTLQINFLKNTKN